LVNTSSKKRIREEDDSTWKLAIEQEWYMVTHLSMCSKRLSFWDRNTFIMFYLTITGFLFNRHTSIIIGLSQPRSILPQDRPWWIETHQKMCFPNNDNNRYRYPSFDGKITRMNSDDLYMSFSSKNLFRGSWNPRTYYIYPTDTYSWLVDIRWSI
jgi:hypothetical protein